MNKITSGHLWLRYKLTLLETFKQIVCLCETRFLSHNKASLNYIGKLIQIFEVIYVSQLILVHLGYIHLFARKSQATVMVRKRSYRFSLSSFENSRVLFASCRVNIDLLSRGAATVSTLYCNCKIFQEVNLGMIEVKVEFFFFYIQYTREGIGS